MDFNATIDLIIKDLDEARNIIDDLKKYPGVPALQVELAKSKCKSAAEVISLLKTLRNNISEISEMLNEPEQLKQPELPDSAPSVTAQEGSKKLHKKESESPIFADRFSHMSNRFNEQLGSKKGDDDVSDILKTQPLTNLSAAIGVNDKFLFIREIFNGNRDAYNQAILKLDNVESLTEARSIILSYTDDSDENKAVKQLLDLVKRKLPSNE
ncbi:MAG TPA: hypothetical protein VMV77_17560 [Bacteroidales bacterium]|nr:hypothetical protein [Bacteroidales bacterium]